jgi:hypothetical protein
MLKTKFVVKFFGKIAALFFLALAAVPSARASDQLERKAAILALAEILPDANPGFDPGFLNSGAVREAFSANLLTCSVDPDSMRTIDRLISIFEQAREMATGGPEFIAAELARMSELDDHSRERLVSEGAKAPDWALAGLRNSSCRALLESYFELGASKKELVEMVEAS